MPVQVFLETRHITSRAVRRIIKRGGLAAIAAGLGVISVSMYGVDPAVGYSQALAAAPHSSPTGRRSIPASPINLQVREPNRQLQRAGLVDQLYGDLMRSSECKLTPSKTSIGEC